MKPLINLNPNCAFCKGTTESGGSMTGADPFTHIIRYCRACNSQQHFIYGTDTLLSYNMFPKSELHSYYLLYDVRTRKLHISRIVKDTTNIGNMWIPMVDTTLSEHPVWLAHDFISEHRIQTLKVFS